NLLVSISQSIRASRAAAGWRDASSTLPRGASLSSEGRRSRMTRLRQTIWAIALWTVLVVLFWIGTVVELDAGCATAGIAASECPREFLIVAPLMLLAPGGVFGPAG